MTLSASVEKEARRLCTHTVVFTRSVDKLCAVRAMQGRTTRSIALELGLSMAEVQYRIVKAQKSLNTRFRQDYRSGNGKIAQRMLKVTESIGMKLVEHEIAPKFIPLAKVGVPRTP